MYEATATASDEPEVFDEPEAKKIKRAKVPSAVVDKVKEAILAMGQPSSFQAIHKYCIETYGYDNVKAIRKQLKTRGEGALEAITAQKFWVVGEVLPPPPMVPTVSIEEVSEGTGEGVENGDSVVINYSLALATESKKVIEKGKGFDFQVGGGEMILL